MDYKEMYEQAIKRAKAMIQVAANQEEIYNSVITIFPELKESEDERVRKKVIDVLKLNVRGAEDTVLWLCITIKVVMILKKNKIVMAKYIPLDAVITAIKKRMSENEKKKSLPQFFGMVEEDLNILSILDTLEVKEIGVDLGDPKGDKSAKYIIDTKNLEVKEVDFWHKQSEEDIDDSIIGWSMHSFICLMKDGTTQEFTGIQDESYEGDISKHLNCVDDNYEWEYDDIVYWIEIPMIKAQKGE